VLDPVAALALGAEGLERGDEVGLGEAGGDPGPEVGLERFDVCGLVGEAGGEGIGGGGDSLDELAQVSGVVGGGVD
jgi:hypothetical protein